MDIRLNLGSGNRCEQVTRNNNATVEGGGVFPPLYLNFLFSSTCFELNLNGTPMTTDESCCVLSILGSVSQS